MGGLSEDAPLTERDRKKKRKKLSSEGEKNLGPVVP